MTPEDDGPERARLAELRDATAGVHPSPGFTDRVMAAALARVPARPPGVMRAARYAIPCAVLLAVVTLIVAWRTEAAAERRRAAAELAQALSDPAVAPW